MEAPPRPSSKIFSTSPVDIRDESEERFDKAAAFLQATVSGMSEKDAHDALTSVVSRGQHIHDDVNLGFLYNILTDPVNAARSYRDLTLISRDGLAYIVGHLNSLLGKRFNRILGPARRQLVWVLKEMMKNNITGVDAPCGMILRHLSGGDLSQSNIELTTWVLEALCESRAWLEKMPFMVALTVYTYLRLMEDHMGPDYAALRTKEAQFVVSLMRERWADCVPIGRDLIRLLQNVARIPEVDAFWRDLLNNPTSLMPNFPGVLCILHARTPRRFLASRITIDMEEKLVFIANSVKMGSQKRYQEWFYAKYFVAPESQTLRCDLIRYIVGVIHPTNEQLSSNLTPRWAILWWLLTSCSNSAASANAKLALFYDWLFFQTKNDNIMNIEPAILLLVNTVKPQISVSATLLDFLVRIMNNYLPSLMEEVKAGICTSLRQILEKRVVPSLDGVFNHPSLDRTLKAVLDDHFGEFFATDGKVSNMVTQDDADPATEFSINGGDVEFDSAVPSPTFSDGSDEENGKRIDDDDYPLDEEEEEEDGQTDGLKSPAELYPNIITEPLDTKADFNIEGDILGNKTDYLFSYDDEEDPGSDIVVGMSKFKYRPSNEVRSPPADITSHLSLIDSSFREKVVKLRKITEQIRGKNSEEDEEQLKENASDLVREIVESLSDKWERGREDMVEPLAICLCAVLNDQLEGKLLPESLSKENLEQSVSMPLFALFEVICEMGKEDHKRQPVVNLIAEMYAVRPSIGYRLLYYLKVKMDVEGEAGNWAVYRDLCRSLQAELGVSLVRDVEFCQDEDPDLFMWLLPELYDAFPDQALANCELMHRLVSHVDFNKLNQLVCRVIRGKAKLMKASTLPKLIQASYEWDHWEQTCLWQLVIAHDFSLPTIVNCLPLPDRECSVAALNLLTILKSLDPSAELVSRILATPCSVSSQEDFVSAVFSYWTEHHYRDVCQIVSNLIVSHPGNNSGSASPSKRKRAGGGGGKSTGPTLDQLLNHLERIRLESERNSLMNAEEVLQALRQAESSCTDEQLTKFADLFKKVQQFTVKASRSGGKKNARKAASGSGNKRPKGKQKTASDSEEDSDDYVGPKQAKRRRQVSSDSE